MATPSTSNQNKFIHVYNWAATDRHWSPRGRNWYLGYAVTFVILITLAALTEQYFLILALIALLFLLYAQASSPPRSMRHEITSLGLKAFDQLFRWSDISGFWVSEKVEGGIIAPITGLKQSYRQVNFEMPKKNPSRLSLLIGDGDEEKIVFSLLEYIPYSEDQEVGNDFISRQIYGKHLPLKDYAPSLEVYPEEEDLPAQEIKTDEAKETKRKEQLEAVKGEEKTQPQNETKPQAS